MTTTPEQRATLPDRDTERHGDVTYSPQDDKLRVYFALRQPEEVTAHLKEAGFRWAGAQDCWFAVWSPTREDVALSVTGAVSIDDEPSTIEDRAAARAERFEGYAENAAAERDARHVKIDTLCEATNGQPVLIGHHSEKRHRRDLARMDENMRKAYHANKRAEYWASRAAGSVNWAHYKEKPGVRARRIKTLGAEMRRFQRTDEEAARVEAIRPDCPFLALKEICNVSRAIPYGAWSKLDEAANRGDEAMETARVAVLAEIHRNAAETRARCSRWIVHLEGRIAYETAQLAAQGAESLIAPKPRDTRRARMPLLNIEDSSAFRMTSADYQAIHKDYRGTRIVGNRYRVRTALVRGSLGTVFLTDKKAAPAPDMGGSVG